MAQAMPKEIKETLERTWQRTGKETDQIITEYVATPPTFNNPHIDYQTLDIIVSIYSKTDC